MLFYKAWRESKLRYLASAGLIAAMCFSYAMLSVRLYPGVAHAHSGVHGYVQYIYWTVFGGITRGMFQLSCLLLGLGGLQRDRRQNSLGFTLALPVSRARLVTSRAAVGTLQIFTLSMVPALVLPLASRIAGRYIPMTYVALFIPLWIAGGIFTFSVSFLASVLFTSEYVSLAVAYVGYIFYLAAVRHPRLSHFHLHAADFMSGLFPHYLDRTTRLWTGNYGLEPIVWFVTAGLGLMAIGAIITRRQDL